jgi:FYVE zinc finger
MTSLTKRCIGKMNLDSIPESVWDQLAGTAINARGHSIGNAVRDRFYQIYETSSRGCSKYEPSEVEVRWREAAWKEKVASMESALKGKQLKDVAWDGYGTPMVQSDRNPLLARIGEQYNSSPSVARFQFLTKTGGGVNLFNTMQEVCQGYIAEELKGRVDQCVVQVWKVFSESGGTGRSDSCVVYLTEPYTRPSVTNLVEKYVWPRVKGFVEDQFVPMGFFRIGGKPIWAINLTQVSDQMQIASLGTVLSDSAGHSIGTLLGKAFADAVGAFEERKEIIAAAKQNAQGLLYDLRLVSWRPDDSTQSCTACAGAFTFLNRRHHCRVCGDIFCGACCQELDINLIAFPVEAPKGPEKGNVYVCALCRRNLKPPVNLRIL